MAKALHDKSYPSASGLSLSVAYDGM